MFFNLISAIDKTVVLQSLEILWKGMLGIFIVMAVIFLFVKLMNLLSAGARAKKQEAADEAAEASQDAITADSASDNAED